jgi:hypothetical protein
MRLHNSLKTVIWLWLCRLFFAVMAAVQRRTPDSLVTTTGLKNTLALIELARRILGPSVSSGLTVGIEDNEVLESRAIIARVRMDGETTVWGWQYLHESGPGVSVKWRQEQSEKKVGIRVVACFETYLFSSWPHQYDANGVLAIFLKKNALHEGWGLLGARSPCQADTYHPIELDG